MSYNNLSRRRFLNGAVAAGGISFTGLCAWGALLWNGRKTAPRRLTPDDGLSLAEYLTREAPKMDYFPCQILSELGVRFRAALTFERYLKFYRYKERVLASTREEIDDCVRQIDDFPVKTKALILAATRLFYLLYSPGSGYAESYRKWLFKKRSQAFERPPRLIIKRNGIGSFEERSYRPDKRSYYPYYYPVLQFIPVRRAHLILGTPSPDSSLGEDWTRRLRSLVAKYIPNEEVAFPFPTVDDEEISNDGFEETSRRLEESPLRFLRFSSRRYIVKGFSQLIHEEWSADQMEGISWLDAPTERNPKLWSKWFKNIEECVAIIRRELGLSISPERWISDYYPDADAFLQKVAELENDKSVPFDKVELLSALREYWFSMQISFDYDYFDEYYATTSAGGPPFIDVLDNYSLSLRDVAAKFGPQYGWR